MLYKNVQQGVICRNLDAARRNAELTAKSYEDHIIRIHEKIGFEQRILDSLHKQAKRTGDPDFAIDIRQKKDAIKKLEREIVHTEDLVGQWRKRVAEIETELARNGCSGHV